MKTYLMTVFVGSVMLTHESQSLYGIINAVRELAKHMPDYNEAFSDPAEMDKLIERLVGLKNSKLDMLVMKTPFLRIECVNKEG